jgi:hypothetical protein
MTPFRQSGPWVGPCIIGTIDGEAVVCDPQGVTSFDALRSTLASRRRATNVFLYAFDIIEPTIGQDGIG